MTKSSNLEFDYLVAAQTQKHVTVNNALARIDASTQWVVLGAQSAATAPKDGEIYLADDDVKLALFLNAGFVEIAPQPGWSAYFLGEGRQKRFDGQGWRGANETYALCIEHDYDVASGSLAIIESKSVVVGITARVLQTLEGAGANSWRIGVPEDHARYGQGLWLGQNGWSKGLTGTPITYWQDTPVEIRGEGGVLSSGKIKLYIYLMQLDVPPEI